MSVPAGVDLYEAVFRSKITKSTTALTSGEVSALRSAVSAAQSASATELKNALDAVAALTTASTVSELAAGIARIKAEYNKIAGPADELTAAVRAALVELSKVVPSSSSYYRGEGDPDLGYIKVKVPPGTYDLLLIGGYELALLAAGFEPFVEIKSGQANAVSVTLSALPPQWDGTAGTSTFSTGDFYFSGGGNIGGGVSGADRLISITPVPDETAVLSVAFNAGKYTGTLIAANNTAGKLTVQKPVVQLLPSKALEFPFNTVNFVPAAALTDLDTTVANSTFTAAAGALPRVDIEGVLVFELTYTAFGDTTGATISPDALTPWVIRNGINRKADDGKAILGGGFAVKIGTGFPNSSSDE
jgi:hypothetical protein